MSSVEEERDKWDNKKRREYSRRGCRECKRRKIKCDEGKPSCWQCDRLMKSCSYPEAGEKVPRVSRRKLIAMNQNVSYSSSPSDGPNGAQLVFLISKANDSTRGKAPLAGSRELEALRPTDENRFANQSYSSNSPHVTPDETQSSPATTTSSATKLSLPQQYLHLRQPVSGISRLVDGPASEYNTDNSFIQTNCIDLDENDLHVLVSDLNQIVNNIMDGTNFEKDISDIHDPFKDFPMTSDISSRKGRPNDRSYFLIIEDERIEKNIPIDYITATKSHEKLYLAEFYNDFANFVLPFHAYCGQIQAYYNPVRDILLQRASQTPFLLAAILAQGAKTCLRKNFLPEDEEAYCIYLSKCLKLLEPAISTILKTNDKTMLSSNIETVLLTVLLLTSSNAANKTQDWRPHLRGAKDLLLKLSSNKMKYVELRNSKVLIFCKFWFISIEILAGLSSKYGGSLKNEEELDLLFAPGSEHEIKALKELGIMRDDGFNLLCGYHFSCVYPLRDLIKLLNRARKRGHLYEKGDSMECVRLLHEFYKQSKIQFVDQRGILSVSHGISQVSPEGNLIDTVKLGKEELFLSWMDISHQCYVLASLISIFTKGLQLPYDAPHVQDITSTLLSMIAFLENIQDGSQLIKFAIMMIQWPMFVAGLNCTTEEQRFLIMKYFRMSAQMGSGSAGFALKIISRCWKKRLFELERDSTDTAEDTNADIMTY